MATRGPGAKLAIAMLCLDIRLKVIEGGGEPHPHGRAESGDRRYINSTRRRGQKFWTRQQTGWTRTRHRRTGTEDDGYVTSLPGGPPPVSLFLSSCDTLHRCPMYTCYQFLFSPTPSSSQALVFAIITLLLLVLPSLMPRS